MSQNDFLSTGRHAMSVKEVAAAAGICRATVYNQMAAGKLVAVKVGRRTLILGAEFSRWLAALPRV